MHSSARSSVFLESPYKQFGTRPIPTAEHKLVLIFAAHKRTTHPMEEEA
jgi:hypothetical protein